MGNKNLVLKLELESPLLIGSGQGWGSEIDSDIVFDNYGLPYIPARRIKGVLRESAQEVVEMMEKALLFCSLDTELNGLFGDGSQESKLNINNLYPEGMENYQSLRKWIAWAREQDKIGEIFQPQQILNAITSLRQATEIEDGIAKKNSLRTLRVLNPAPLGYFEGQIQISAGSSRELKLFSYACANLRRIGTMRNRGLGKVRCMAIDENGQSLLKC